MYSKAFVLSDVCHLLYLWIYTVNRSVWQQASWCFCKTYTVRHLTFIILTLTWFRAIWLALLLSYLLSLMLSADQRWVISTYKTPQSAVSVYLFIHVFIVRQLHRECDICVVFNRVNREWHNTAQSYDGLSTLQWRQQVQSVLETIRTNN